MSRLRAVLAVSLAVFLVSGCSSLIGTVKNSNQATTVMPEAPTTVIQGTDAISLALGTSQAIYQASPAVVLVADQDAASMEIAQQTAERLGVPLLVTPATETEFVRAEIDRLGSRTVVTAGAGAAAWAASAAFPTSIAVVNADAAPADVSPAPALTGLVVLAAGNGPDAAAISSAKGAGARVLVLGASDPRASSQSVQAIKAEPSLDKVLAIGSGFGIPERLRARLGVAKTAPELPGGGQLVFPGRFMVALYGHPTDKCLGHLGGQREWVDGQYLCGGVGHVNTLDEAVAEAKEHAALYDPIVDLPVVPTFEIIATIAASYGTDDGDYSLEPGEPDSRDLIAEYRAYIERAQAEGIYVLLDLQPGRDNFLNQAKQFEELLKYPNVGLAVDPEWRMGDTGIPIVSGIGRVMPDELNDTGQWLAELTRVNNLPQKLYLIHWFHTRSLCESGPTCDRPKDIKVNYDELAVMIHFDGIEQIPGAKVNMWNLLRQISPPSWTAEPASVFWAWKNFYDECQGCPNLSAVHTYSPEETLAVSDDIVFVSYQ